MNSTRKNKQLKAGQSVKLIAYEQKAKVIDCLASQFTVALPNGKVLFFFYADRGATWTPI